MYYQNSLYYLFIRIMANFRKLAEFVKNLNNQFLRISQNIIQRYQSILNYREIFYQKSFNRSNLQLKYMLQSLETPSLVFQSHQHQIYKNMLTDFCFICGINKIFIILVYVTESFMNHRLSKYFWLMINLKIPNFLNIVDLVDTCSRLSGHEMLF